MEFTAENLKKRADELKKQYNLDKIHHAKVRDINTGKEYNCLLKKPGFTEMGPFNRFLGTDPVRAFQTLVNAIWLDGDEEIRTEYKLFDALTVKIRSIVGDAEAELGEL